jgi:hypothetical protein
MIPKLTISTGASSNHFLPLQSLLWTIAEFEPTARVIAYDLGLTADEHAYLAHTPPFFLKQFELRTFAFANYPPHFSIALEAGRMAFRPTVLAAIAQEFETDKTAHATRHSVSLSTIHPQPSIHLLWLDSGCQLREPLHEIRACIRRDGIYSPCAPGTIETTLHPTARDPLAVTEDQLPLPIRDAGICGFDLTPQAATVCDPRGNLPPDRRKNIRALLNRWAEIALNENATAPAGSTRHTHRQDAVFTVLLNQVAKTHGWKLETNRLRGLAIKQDHLTLAETNYRAAGSPPPPSPKPASKTREQSM